MAGPAWDVAIAPAATLGASSYPPFWVSIAGRIMRQSDSSAGKQYELDQAQTGESHHVLDNRDAAFSPVNSSSPYSPSVTAFKPVRWRAQYPATTNILTVDQATGGSTQASGSTVDTVVPVWISYDAFWTVKAESDAYTGPNVFQQILAAGPGAGNALAEMGGWTVRPGAAHSAQCVMRATAGGTTPQVQLVLAWRDASGNAISFATGSTVTLTANSRTWQQVTVSGTPPANAAGATVQIVMVNSVAVTVQASGFQVEYAASPSSWAQPGVWYPLFTGGAERWPQVYDMNGTYGKTRPIIDDAFAVLAQVYPQPAFYQDVLATNPRFFYPLNDPAGSTSCVDITGRNPNAQVVNSPYGAGAINFGQAITSTSPASVGGVAGYSGPVAAFNNPDPTGGSASTQAATWIDLSSAGILGPVQGGSGMDQGWSRMVAFNAGTTIPAHSWSLNAFAPPTFANVAWGTGNVGLQLSGNDFSSPGFLALVYGATGVQYVTSNSLFDGNWHLVLWSITPPNATNGNSNYMISVWVDGQYVGLDALPTWINFSPITTDTVGATVFAGSNYVDVGAACPIALIAEWPYYIGKNAARTLTSTVFQAQMTNLYTSWRSAWAGESSGSRYARILGYAGYLGAANLQSGTTTSMGPASDIDGFTSALTLLENVVTTESGTHYVDANGTLRFESRASRYNQLTPVYTFGENTAGGEWPYEDVAFDFDTTRVVGQAQITQFSTKQLFIANSPATLAPNYRPTFQRTINVSSPNECVDAANYIAGRYQKPLLRVQTIRLHPSAVTGMWPIALSLAISMRVRVMRRAPGAPVIQFDGFIENVKWARDWDTGEAIVDLQMSPANLQQYWVLAALHTTLKNAATSGTNSITCNPLPDSASNPAAASFCSGLQITLDPGNPALAETLTVSSFGATSPGYTSFTITFTANMANNHSIGAVVCEKLPAGVTDPTTWDSASILGTTTTLSY